MSKPHILIATPCFGGQVAQIYMTSVLRLQAFAAQAGFTVGLSLLGYDALISRARSTLLGAFLDDPRATHLLFIDADIGFAPEQVERLLHRDRDFVGALYPLKAVDWEHLPRRCVEGGESLPQAALSYVGEFCPRPERREEDGFATAIYAGGGFQMIRRQAVEKMIAAYPETHYSRVQSRPKSGPVEAQSGNLYALFDSIIDPETRVYLSEDYSFCRRWRALGGEIWLDLHSRLTHVGPAEFAGDHSARVYSLALEG